MGIHHGLPHACTDLPACPSGPSRRYACWTHSCMQSNAFSLTLRHELGFSPTRLAVSLQNGPDFLSCASIRPLCGMDHSNACISQFLKVFVLMHASIHGLMVCIRTCGGLHPEGHLFPYPPLGSDTGPNPPVLLPPAPSCHHRAAERRAETAAAQQGLGWWSGKSPTGNVLDARTPGELSAIIEQASRTGHLGRRLAPLRRRGGWADVLPRANNAGAAPTPRRRRVLRARLPRLQGPLPQVAPDLHTEPLGAVPQGEARWWSPTAASDTDNWLL